jgi:hypothetical protein
MFGSKYEHCQKKRPKATLKGRSRNCFWYALHRSNPESLNHREKFPLKHRRREAKRMVTTAEQKPADFDFNSIQLINPELIFSIYIPLGENSIVQLNDQYYRREDVQILETDLYYQLKIQYDGLMVKFYSRGVIKIAVAPESDRLPELIQQAEDLRFKIPDIIKKLLTKYHLALVGTIPLKKTVHASIVHEGFQGMPSCESKAEKIHLLHALVANPAVARFIRTARSINCQGKEEDRSITESVIIGTHGSIIKSDQIDTLISYHAFVRALHLFLRRYNILLEEIVWTRLSNSDNLIDELDEYIKKQQESDDVGRYHLFSSERRKKLAETRSAVVHSIKDVDNFIMLSNFIIDSIEFTTERFMKIFDAGEVKENSFDIRKVLAVLNDRAEHLKTVSESFASHGRTLLDRLDLYSSEIAVEALESFQDKIRMLDNGTKRARNQELEQSRFSVNINAVILEKPRIFAALFIPLGENGIIRLFSRLRERDDVKVLESDLYYFALAKYLEFTISFYSRGLVLIEIPSITPGRRLRDILEETEGMMPMIPSILKKLLTKYSLSLLEVFRDIEEIPIHKIIVGTKIKIPVEDGSYARLPDEERDEWLIAAAQHPTVRKFIGDARSVNSRAYEDVIIGTEGSIIRSEEMNVLLSFHAYNRALHLFLAKYNLISENVWNSLNVCSELVSDFQAHVKAEEKKSRALKIGLFPSDIHKRLGKVRAEVISGIKDIDNFLVLTSFIEDSINFTIERYIEELEEERIRANSFHIRRVLRTLHDRAKHLKIVSEGFLIRGRTLLTRLDLYDSELAFETRQKLEKIAFITGLLGIILALIAIYIEF